MKNYTEILALIVLLMIVGASDSFDEALRYITIIAVVTVVSLGLIHIFTRKS